MGKDGRTWKENKYIYDANYAKTHFKQFSLKIPFRDEAVIKKLEEVDNRTAYIVGLIHKDIGE